MRKMLNWFGKGTGAGSLSRWLPLVLLTLVPKLASAETPEQLAHRFADFKYEFHAEIQPRAVFLATKKGDCDDFATLAGAILAKAGYTTHLITVRMPGETHVVLYVDQTKSYLDYNYRAAQQPAIPSDGVL